MAFQAWRIAREAERANREAERARQEAAAAREVADFLVNVFEVSDPGAEPGQHRDRAGAAGRGREACAVRPRGASR